MNTVDRLVIWAVILVLGFSTLKGVLEVASSLAVPVAVLAAVYGGWRLWMSGKLAIVTKDAKPEAVREAKV